MPTAPAEHLRLYEIEPHREDGAEHWYARAQNFVTVYSRFEAGARMAVEQSEHEYVIVLVEGAIDITSEAGDDSVEARAQMIVPPGRSEVTARDAGVLVRVFAPPPDDLLARCVNHDSYAEPHPNVAPHELWPEPVGGYRLRVYRYGEGGLIIRSRNIMVNWGGQFAPPRDPSKLSPHSHDDFEQMSMCISGEYIHHIRYPWEPDSTAWMEDEHTRIGTHSITIMPPPAIHTSQGMGEQNSLIDIFAPPRADFSLRGMVHEENAQEYPLPPALRESR
jgi:hypothetical protein